MEEVSAFAAYKDAAPEKVVEKPKTKKVARKPVTPKEKKLKVAAKSKVHFVVPKPPQKKVWQIIYLFMLTKPRKNHIDLC